MINELQITVHETNDVSGLSDWKGHFYVPANARTMVGVFVGQEARILLKGGRGGRILVDRYEVPSGFASFVGNGPLS